MNIIHFKKPKPTQTYLKYAPAEVINFKRYLENENFCIDFLLRKAKLSFYDIRNIPNIGWYVDDGYSELYIGRSKKELIAFLDELAFYTHEKEST